MINSIFILNNLALNLSQDDGAEFIEAVSPSCENATKAIEEFQTKIKKIIGIEKINNEVKY